MTTLHAAGKKRGTIRHAVNVLAMTLDHAGAVPNPARNKTIVRLPREARVEPAPPSADHVVAVFHLLPRRHRLALLWLDGSGARVASIDETLVSDYDEPRRRVRFRAAASKGGRGIWVDLPECLQTPSSRRSDRGTTATRARASSPRPGPTLSERRSRSRARPPAYRSGRRMTCGTAASACCTSAACRGRASASSSGSAISA